MHSIKECIAGLNEERKRIFDMLLKSGPVAKSTILDFTGMKLTTLNRMIQQLESCGLVARTGAGDSSGGRKPCLYDANPEKAYMVGIEISRTSSKIVIANLKMKVVFSEQFAMDCSYTPQKTCCKIAGITKDALSRLSIDKESLLGAGVGTVGPLDRRGGIMTNPVNFPAYGWQDVPIAAMLSEKLGCPVTIDNGANTAVLSEFLFGAGKESGSVAYFNCGVGIRTGAIAGGTIIRSMNDAEDSFGHMIIDVDGEQCSCGNFGCIECYSSISSVVRSFKASVKKGRDTSIAKSMEELDYVDICAAAEQGDMLSMEVLSGAAAILGAGLANYINLLSPGLVILSGPLINKSKLFYDVSTEIAKKKLYKKDENSVAFKRGGHFGDDAIAVGAAALVLENNLESAFSFQTGAL